MLSFSVVKSAGSAGNYYTDKDNYYVLGSMGERWAGQGAEQLGLQGSVDKDVFTRLLEGRLPDGADLSRMQDGSNKHRPGYDLTFSAPKSVSMMAMLGGDKRLIDAHNQAVDFAVRQVEALASTRVMTDGQSETVLTGNLVMALFNHDTSRDQDPQLHTHVVVANVTQHNGEWKTLSSDKVGKTGFSENVLANRIAFGKIYQSELRQRVEALGYETEVVGKHGMWEMPGVPVEAFSGRSQAIREAVGEDASLKSRDVAALDTRKSKQHVDPEVRMAEWMQTLKETGFDIRAYRDAADQRAEIRTQAPGPASQDGPDVQQAVTQAIAGLSERKVQFTYTDVLARTVGILPPENGVIERARAGIDEAISREQLIPLDREKGLFTSGIHVLDELSVRALSRDIMKQNRVTVHPEKSVPRTAGYSDAVSVLAQDRPSLAIVSGQGGAAGQRERVAELVMMAREQGREVQIIAADRRSQMNLKQDERLSGELITGRRQLLEGMAFPPGSTVIVDQGEKLSLKETLTLLDGAARHNVQVLITDSGQRTGTGSALMAMKDAGVNTYRWQGGEQRPATIISEPDRNVRYARLAGDFAASVKAGEESVAQVSGVREQAILTEAIRSELKTQGVLGHPEVTMTALSPVWLDSRSRYLRDMYRPGMVMEQWNPETRSHDRYVIDRVTAQSHSLTLRDAQGETQVVRISSLDSSWSLFRPEKMPVADGERLRVTGKIPGLRVSGGDRLQVASVSEDAMTVVVPGRAEPATLPVADSPFTALKLENGWVETPGHSVSDSATVFASVTQMAMDNATLNGLARSGRDVRLYSSLDEPRTAEKLARHPSFTVVSDQIKARAGETLLETAISLQKAGLHTPAQQAIHLALPVLESKNLAFSMVDLLTEAKSFAAEGTGFTELGGEINAQIKRGDLLYVDVAKGYGTGLLVSRASYEAEKSILRHILEGKEAVTPLMERVPGELMETLTSGQRAATRMILETSDRFTVVQGYAGVGKTTQFRAVMSAVNMLPASERPRVVGLGPTHRAVGEMRSAGVDAQTLASFLHDTQLQQRSGETPDFSNTLFLLDESSMVGNTDMARAYALIAAGGGRAVASGDTDQLQAIAPGQPFRLQQTRSAADVVIMKEIVRQTPELREAVYSLINRDVERALSGLESVKPSQVPRQEGAWAPEHSVTEFSHSQEAKLAEAQQKAMLKGEAFPDIPMTLYEAIVRDYTGRTPEAREQTLIVTHLNEDRRVLNSMIHDAREKAGELGKEQVMVPVLNTANIRDGELRRLSTWENNPDALALVDSVYHRIAGISKDDGLITLEDAEGNTRLISPREAVAEGVTLYKRNVAQMKLSVKWQRTNLTCRTAKQSWLSGILPGRNVTGLPVLNGKPHCRRVCCVNHNGNGKRSGRLPGKICCRSVCSRWSGIWFVTCRKRKPWAETDTGRQTLMTTDNTNTTRNDSLAARTDTWLQSFLVWSPGQRDIIKTVALVLMVLDHINLIFQLKQEWMFLAGRGAFPLFALVWGLNLSRHAHIRQPAINRLWGWGIIAQFAYYLAGFPWYEGNILFAFAVAAQVLTWCETRSGWRTAAAILLMALWGPLSGTSYGIAGLLMLAVSHRLYRAEDRAERLALVACLLAVIPALNLATSDAAAVAGLVMTVLTVGLVSCAGKSLPRFWPGDFFPVFYACHLAVLGVLAL